MSAARESGRVRTLRGVVRPVHVAIVTVTVGFLVLAAVGATLDAVDSTNPSAAVGNALGAAAVVILVALVLDGPLLRTRLARVEAREPSSGVEVRTRAEGEVSEVLRPLNERRSDPVCSDEAEITIRLRPLSP